MISRTGLIECEESTPLQIGDGTSCSTSGEPEYANTMLAGGFLQSQPEMRHIRELVTPPSIRLSSIEDEAVPKKVPDGRNF